MESAFTGSFCDVVTDISIRWYLFFCLRVLAIKFTANEHLKVILMPTSESQKSWLRHFLAGSLAGI
jgi:hypothetical protein